MLPFVSVESALAELRAGGFVVVVDDEDRENEGDLVIAAEHVTPAAINFLATEARGLICVPMLGARLDLLRLPLLPSRNRGGQPTAFTLSVDARAGVTSGISAADRATTIRKLIDPTTGPDDFVTPGHVFPLRYAEGGVLRRPGHTEASVDLALLAGLYPAAVICEVLNSDGTMARLPELVRFSRRHSVPLLSVEQIVEHRRAASARTLVQRLSPAPSFAR